MKNKVIAFVSSGLLTFSVLSFAYDDHGLLSPYVSVQQRINEKITFDNSQAIYNNKANTLIRANKSEEKKTIKQDQEKEKRQEVQDKTKGQVLLRF